MKLDDDLRDNLNEISQATSSNGMQEATYVTNASDVDLLNDADGSHEEPVMISLALCVVLVVDGWLSFYVFMA